MVAAMAGVLAGSLAGRLTARLVEPYCGGSSRRRTLGIALLTAVVWGLLGWRFGVTAELVPYLYIGVVGTLLGFVDVAVKRLPDPFTLPSYVVGVVLLSVAAAFIEGGSQYLVGALLGMAALWTLYGVQHFLMPDMLGRGDVKLAGVLGLYLGWLGYDAWVTGVLAGYLLAGLPSIVLLATQRASRKTEIPMGPFMLAGALAAVLAA